MRKRYRVALTAEERAELDGLMSVRSVERVRRRFVEEDLRPLWRRSRPRGSMRASSTGQARRG